MSNQKVKYELKRVAIHCFGSRSSRSVGINPTIIGLLTFFDSLTRLSKEKGLIFFNYLTDVLTPSIYICCLS